MMLADNVISYDNVRVWNSLLKHITSALSMGVFRSCLKCHLFSISFPSIRLSSACAVTTCHFGHLINLVT